MSETNEFLAAFQDVPDTAITNITTLFHLVIPDTLKATSDADIGC
jgi:hypothetical protein